MFPRLLVPLDGSPTAAQAIPYVTTLARALGSHVRLLSIVEPTPDWSATPRIAAEEADERARALAMAYLGDVADRLHGEGVVVSAEVRQGNPAATILAAAADHDCSLIVMATHGRSGFDRLRLGSVTQHVLRHAPIPTLVVRADEQTPSEGGVAISEITATLDGSATAEQALPAAMALADALHVPVTLFEVMPNYYYAAYAWPGREIRTRWQRGVTNRADPVILSYLADRSAGLVVMASHGRGGIERWVLGSTAEAIIAQPPCSVLVVRGDTTGNAETPRPEELVR
jgi:nucleotide-binding universal stress UspA family protein